MNVFIPTEQQSGQQVTYCFQSDRSLLCLDTPEAIYAVASDTFGEERRQNGVENSIRNGFVQSRPKGERYWRINVKSILEKKRFANHQMEYLFQYGVRCYDGFIIAANREQEFLNLKPSKKAAAPVMQSISLSVCQPRVERIGEYTTTYVVWSGSRTYFRDPFFGPEHEDGLFVDTKKDFDRDSTHLYTNDGKVISKYNPDAMKGIKMISPKYAIEVVVTRPEIMWGTAEEVESQIQGLIIDRLIEDGYLDEDTTPTEKMKLATK